MDSLTVKQLYQQYGITSTARFCDPNYDTTAEHLGVDIPAMVGTNIISHIDGVVKQVISPNTMNGCISIYDGTRCFVFGHIKSSLFETSLVKKGDLIGSVVNFVYKGKSSNHLHFGINRLPFPFEASRTTHWGFGRAPKGSSRLVIFSRGWDDPEIYLNAR